MMPFYFNFIIITLFTLIFHVISASRTLCNFRTESMRIRLPKRRKNTKTPIFDEVFGLIKNHFINRGYYNERDWNNMHEHYTSTATKDNDDNDNDNDPDNNNNKKDGDKLMNREEEHDAIRHFLSCFNDPYTTFFEPVSMTAKSEGFRGERQSMGIRLGRRLKRRKRHHECKSHQDIIIGTASNTDSNSDNKMQEWFKVVHININSNVNNLMMNIKKNRRSLLLHSFKYMIMVGLVYTALFPTFSSSLSGIKSKLSITSSSTSTGSSSSSSSSSVSNSIIYDMIDRINITVKNQWWKYCTATLLGTSLALDLLKIIVNNCVEVYIKEYNDSDSDSGGTSSRSSRSRLNKDDKLLMIDGVLCQPWSLSGLHRMLDEGDINEPVRLTVVRDDYGSNDDSSSSSSSSSGSSSTLHINCYRDFETVTSISSRLLERNMISDSIDGCSSSSSSSSSSSRGNGISNGISKGPIGYIRITSFTDRSLDDMKKTISRIKTTATTSAGSSSSSSSSSSREQQLPLILDLRGNLGGTMPAALDIAALFLKGGHPLMQLVTRKGRRCNSNGSEKNNDNVDIDHDNRNNYSKRINRNMISNMIAKTNSNSNTRDSSSSSSSGNNNNGNNNSKDQVKVYRSTNNKADTRSPLLILVDHRTASASEILAAALSDNHRAVLVGRRTLGKDVAQAVVTLSDGSGVSLTVRAFRTPVGGAMMGGGLQPDLWYENIETLDIDTIKYHTDGTDGTDGSSKDRRSKDKSGRLRGNWVVDGCPVVPPWFNVHDT